VDSGRAPVAKETRKSDEALDDDPLGPKTMKQLVARQPRRGAAATKTGGEC
jgi:hypothetical protein